MIVPAGILFDLDGVIHQGDSIIEGAIDIVRALDSANIPYRFITNNTRMTKSNLILYLEKMGFSIDSESVFTAPLAAIEYCKINGFKRISLIVPDLEMIKDFSCFDLVDKNPEAIVLGDMGALFNFKLMNRIFLDVMNGSHIIAMHKNRYWMADDGLRMDLGAFVSALEYSTGKAAVIIGKSDPNIFKLAVREWMCPRPLIYMVGDDLGVDICGAKMAGMKSVLVKTGKFREDVLSRSKIKPDHIIESIADMHCIFKLG